MHRGTCGRSGKNKEMGAKRKKSRDGCQNPEPRRFESNIQTRACGTKQKNNDSGAGKKKKKRWVQEPKINKVGVCRIGACRKSTCRRNIQVGACDGSVQAAYAARQKIHRHMQAPNV